VAPEFIKKMNSDRIFSTLFYPNALAGALLLILPVAMAVTWRDFTRLTVPARGFSLRFSGAALWRACSGRASKEGGY
jgi:hypothetical protein